MVPQGFSSWACNFSPKWTVVSSHFLSSALYSNRRNAACMAQLLLCCRTQICVYSPGQRGAQGGRSVVVIQAARQDD